MYSNYKIWFKIPDKYLDKIKKDFPKFGLTYLYQFNFNSNAKASYLTRDDLLSYQWYKNPLYFERKLTYKENSSTKTLSKILNSTFHISNKSETLSAPKRLKNTIDTGTNNIKNLVQEIGDLSQLSTDQKNVFLYKNRNLAKPRYYTELDKNIKTYEPKTYFDKATMSDKYNLITLENKTNLNKVKNAYKVVLTFEFSKVSSNQKIETKNQ